MQIGNRKALDDAREALRDAFDRVWTQSKVLGETEKRAIRCAIALDAPRAHPGSRTSWRIFPGGGCTYTGAIKA